ncbi:MAG: accessory gene regulator B family protein, partial [Eubacteriales bacterium]|nr:accessory gene regulator B family protein [Eubacteriales bacterium]
MYAKIQSIYGFSDYQIAQLRFTFRTVISEISKLIILALIFRNTLLLFIWAAILLRLTRASTGGIHCGSYISCL